MFKNYLRSLLNITILSVLTAGSVAFAQSKKTEKGLLPEVVLDSNDEDKNQDKAYKSELLITKSENKAIEALQKIIVKKKGTVEEADLRYRLAELYMRRAKSGRFFDLNSDPKKPGFVPNTLNQSASTALNAAIKIYESILNQFPKYENIDAVLFNLALANMQVNQVEKAKTYYTRITTEFTKSVLYPDALLELGELYYNQHNFTTALEQLKKIDAYPKSKAYPHGAYKQAWCYYNLKQNDLGIKKLKSIVEANPADSIDNKKFNFREEALNDLTLFVEESIEPDQLYSFFRAITTDKELGEVMLSLATLFESHSHHKEINIFIKEFIDKNESSPYASKAYIKLIDANENLKARDAVLGHLQKLSDFCYENPSADANCKADFKKVSLEISKKWWDIWLKNKNHIEFSKLTEKSFEILLSKDDVTKPDTASRFAYAELLFQLGKYEKASENYEIASKDPKWDVNKKHDALYGAIYSIDKLIERDKKNEDVYAEQQQQLTLRYVSEFPKGEHQEPLRFKLGFMAYQKQDTDNALKYLSPIAASAKDASLKVKSEDIILDIYNLKKDYKAIQAFAQTTLNSTTQEPRKKALGQIKEEARFSQMQIEMEKQPAEKRIETLMGFSNEHKNSKLSKEALWQSISLAYANGLEVKGAGLSLNYYEKFPQDPKSLDSLKEAVKAYTDAGYINESIKTISLLAKADTAKADSYTETTCGLYNINGQIKESQQCYKALYLKSNDKNKKSQLLTKLNETLVKDQTLSDIEGMDSIIAKENIEPYVTQALISKARKFLDDKKFSEAFQLSLKVNSRQVDADIRAEARLIQAEILEKEFVAQSVKSSEAKFSLVLSMKTEKLDKAYTAYTSTIKMSKSPKIHEHALKGIDRLYTHFIDAISNMPLPASLSKADQEALKIELTKMTEPFAVKRQDNLAKIKEITKDTNAIDHVVWSSLSAEKTVAPHLAFPVSNKFTSYLPSEFKQTTNDFTRLSSEALDVKKCDVKKLTAQSIGSCINSKKMPAAEVLAKQLTATKENRPLGLYYLSVIADNNGQQFKSLWFIEKALALEPEISMFHYQKGKIVYAEDGIDAALPSFEKSIDLKRNSKELSLISGLKSFTDKDFISASDELKKLSLEDQDKYNISTVLVESMAQKGNAPEAIQWAEKFLNSYPKSVDMHIQLARVYEEFPQNVETSKKLAIDNYQKALNKSDNNEQKNWLKRKISFLSEAK